ncbi:metallopeptidase TldD-related protein, partial [Escherichia coli]
LEATSVAKNASVFANKLGEKVASDLVTYIDDGTLENEWGSLNIDDEGEKSRKNVLIEDGILKGYMIDKLNGRRMGMESTGSSRRQSYRFAPTSRMTNT